MSTNDTTRHESTGVQNPQWSGPHREPAAQGGKRYYRCTGCHREALAAHRDNLTHADDCPHR